MDEETARPHLRAVLHHEGAWQGHRVSACRRSTASSCRAAGISLRRAAPGEESIFRIFLPAMRRTVGFRSCGAPPADVVGGRETVLVVEDDELVLEDMRATLSSGGYTLLEAANGEEAIALFQGRVRSIDLMITDVIMPKMGRKELNDWMAAQRRGEGPLRFRIRGQRISPGTAVRAGRGVPPETIYSGGIAPDGAEDVRSEAREITILHFPPPSVGRENASGSPVFSLTHNVASDETERAPSRGLRHRAFPADG